MTKSGLTPSEKAQRQYYGRIANTYDEHYSNEYALKYRYSLYDRMLKNTVDVRELRVLDAMCGGGQAAGYFVERGARVIGNDISEEQCAVFRARYPGENVICGSILDAAFYDSSFDLVVTDSLHHLHPSLDEGMVEILRILKPNGYFLLWEPSANSIIDLFRALWYRFDSTYFEKNEESIDLDDVMRRHGKDLHLLKKIFGGNVAYLLVQESLLFRVPPGLIKHYASSLFAIENFLAKFQNQLSSCWFLALAQKRDGRSRQTPDSDRIASYLPSASRGDAK